MPANHTTGRSSVRIRQAAPRCKSGARVDSRAGAARARARAHHRREPAVPVRPARLAGSAHARRRPAIAVSIICPKAPGYEKSFEQIDGIDIHRHSLPSEADGVLGYALEYSVALAMEFWLSLKILFGRGFDVIHACNPPDTIFLIGALLQAVRQEIRVRSPRHQSGALRSEVRQARLRPQAAGGARAHELQHRGHGDLDQRVVSPHRDRTRRQESAATCSWCVRARI